MYNNPSLPTSSAWALIAKVKYPCFNPTRSTRRNGAKTIDTRLSVLYTRSRSRVVNNPVLHMSLKGVV
jgi:hypothetical protein